jgi:hypothetical protein
LLDRWQADPKFPEEPKFGMVPPSTPDRLLFGRHACGSEHRATSYVL